MITQIKEIKGLYILHNFLSNEEHDHYFNILRNESTNDCHQVHTANEFGWKFIPVRDINGDIIKRTHDDYLGFSDWALELKNMIINRLEQKIANVSYINQKKFNVDHMLINKYMPGDGCRPHIDDPLFWTNVIIGVSFGASTIMTFHNKDIGNIIIDVPKCSLYILTDSARYEWVHEIPYSKTDIVHGNHRNREYRISVTLRKIVDEYLPQ